MGRIYLDANGVTVKCEGCEVGFKSIINGEEYEVVDSTLLVTRLNQGIRADRLVTTLVTNMSNLFYRRVIGSHIIKGRVYKEIEESLDNWDVSSVTDMKEMFCGSNYNKPLFHWDVSNVKNMNSMFMNSVFNQNIQNWNVSSVTDMSSMFNNSTFNQPIDNWNVSKVENMSNMFCYSFFNQ